MICFHNILQHWCWTWNIIEMHNFWTWYFPFTIDVAEVVFNKCVELSDDAPDSEEVTAKMDYEFLEDIYVNWHQSGEDDISITSKGNTLKESETNSTFGPDDQNQEYESIDNKTTEEIERQLEKKNSHPLMLMV